MRKVDASNCTIFYQRADCDLWELAEQLLKEKSPPDLSSLVLEESTHTLVTHSTPLRK